MRCRITVLFIVLMLLVACGVATNRYEGIWASNMNEEYITFDKEGNFSYVKMSYDYTKNGDSDKYIKEASYGIVQDDTLLINSKYYGSTGLKYHTPEEIPEEEIVKLPSRQSIVIEFETDYVFGFRDYTLKFTKQADDYEIPYTRAEE